jgi:hypothetical protein
MRKLFALSLFCALNIFTAFGQSTYFGKHFAFDFNVLGRSSFIADRFTGGVKKEIPHYKYQRSRLNTYHNFDYGIAGQFTYLTNSRVSFGVNYMYYNSDIKRTAFEYDYADYSSAAIIQGEDMKFKTITITPIISISSEELMKPVGLTHEFGIGFTKSTLVDKDYHFYRTDGSTVIDTNVHYFKGTEFKGISLMYTLKLSKPISKNVVFNFGVRYALNFGNENGRNAKTEGLTESGYYNSYYFFESDATHGLNRNFINILTGLTLLL